MVLFTVTENKYSGNFLRSTNLLSMLTMVILFNCLIALASSAIANGNLKYNSQSVKKILVPTTGRKVLPVPDLIRSYNYSAETHHVTTEDGYVLEMHRITESPKYPSAKNKPAVFVMHGLLSSSADFVSVGPEIGPGYALADAGYDVWMGNARGNTWSRKNINNLTYEEFWKFSWEEIGTRDLPAMVDYILEKTGLKKIPYIGHSQGTTVFFVLLSTKPEYNDKFSFLGGLAPTAFLTHVKTPLQPLHRYFVGIEPFNLLANATGVGVLSHDSLIVDILRVFCQADEVTRDLCVEGIFLLFGYDLAQLNVSMLSTILDYCPAGVSIRQLIHFAQVMNSGRFRRYDYGLLNYQKYGQSTPPDYNVSLITVPCLLVFGNNDFVNDAEDVTNLYSLLRNGIELRKVAYPDWNHIDFLWGRQSRKYVYNELIETMTKYDTNF